MLYILNESDAVCGRDEDEALGFQTFLRRRCNLIRNSREEAEADQERGNVKSTDCFIISTDRVRASLRKQPLSAPQPPMKGPLLTPSSGLERNVLRTVTYTYHKNCIPNCII